ncbi:exodeoxyribonuclease VII small subunit [Alterileibacterium massiliense]|uniref:exodeoxyribonuclease VII small subunit n=1 Tax=Alterileibacterium massiliense TaxID=1870997 RepID=UPI0019676DBC|nr:exodeoxyribonuclease VII small subunit [Alterileibacterium massiliense]
MMSNMPEKEKTFLESLEILKNNANEIGKQSTSLEDSLKLFDEGMKEAKFCEDILNNAEQKIEIYRAENE